MSTSVKFFLSSQAGAPTLSGTAGSLISLLDACLVNGYNLKAATGLSVTNGVANLTCGVGHGFWVDQVVLVSGATPNELNGEKRVISISSDSIRYAAQGVPDGTATGTITVRAAPLGWQKVFSATNKAAYRSTNPAGTRLFLRVDDTNSRYAIVQGWEELLDVDNGVNWWSNMFVDKSSVSDTSTRAWSLVGDDRAFYLGVRFHSLYSGYDVTMFGDIISYKPGDAYNCVHIGTSSHGGSNPGFSNYFSNIEGTSTGKVLARAHTQLGGSLLFGVHGHRMQTVIGLGGYTYPNPADNSLILHTPLLITESGGARGEFPGLIQPLHAVPLSHGTIVSVPEMPGRKIMFLNSSYSSSQIAQYALDITGPWR